MEASQALGLAYAIDAATRDAIIRFGMDNEAPMSTVTMLPVPGVFIINQAGVIRFEYVNPNFKEQVDPEVLLAAAKCIATNK
jgi:peroxiredoxin